MMIHIIIHVHVHNVILTNMCMAASAEDTVMEVDSRDIFKQYFDHVQGHVILTWSPVVYWDPSPPS